MMPLLEQIRFIRNTKSKQMNQPPSGLNYYWPVVHGGIGDFSWVYSKLSNLSYPLFVEVSNELPSRPKRIGDFLNHLPKVLGWRYSDEFFAGGKNTWIPAAHPAAFYGKSWKESKVPLNRPFKIEANRFLEDGHNLSRWLPDLPTNYHYDITQPAASSYPVDARSVILHFTGWQDISDDLWCNAVAVLKDVASVHMVTGSYDGRTASLRAKLVKQFPNLNWCIDALWKDLFKLLAGCRFCIGHASGITILANVLRIPGACYNPANLPNLRGTWSDPDFSEQRQISTPDQFDAVVHQVCCSLRSPPSVSSATIPPAIPAGLSGHELVGRIENIIKEHYSAPDLFEYGWVRALGRFYRPRSILFVNPVAAEVTAFLNGTLDSGVPVAYIALAGNGDLVRAANEIRLATYRSCRPCIIQVIPDRLESADIHRKITPSFSAVLVNGDAQVSVHLLSLFWSVLGNGGILMVSGLQDDLLRHKYEQFSSQLSLPVSSILRNYGILQSQ